MSPPSPLPANFAEALSNSAGALSVNERYRLLQPVLGDDLCRRLGVYLLPEDFLLSVVIPVFNEVETIATVIERVRGSGVPCEIIVVDDGSTDGTRKLLETWRDDPVHRRSDLKILLHDRNQGKGAAVRNGFALATGQAVILQDADLEYDPADYLPLLQPLVEDQADVVYGSRFSERNGVMLTLWHTWANQAVSLLASLRTGRRLSDVETCYKLVRRETLDRVRSQLRENRFGLEIELTLLLSRVPGVRFHERPIRYLGRSYAEGKKITWRDGLRALWCLLRY